MKNGFYIYRFINKDERIVYVGKTTNLNNRFKQHKHLTDDITKIEYIKCATEADMTWKEIYYINLYKNEKTTNDSFLCNDSVTAYDFGDIWIEYKKKLNGQYEIRYYNEKDIESFYYYNPNAKIINPDDIYTYIKYKKGLNPRDLYVVSFETFISTDYYSGGYYFTKENELLYNSTYTIAEAALYNEEDAKTVANILNKNIELLYNIKPNYEGCYIARSFDSCITTDINPIIREDFKDKIEKTKSCMPGIYIIPEYFTNGMPDRDYMKFIKNATSC